MRQSYIALEIDYTSDMHRNQFWPAATVPLLDGTL